MIDDVVTLDSDEEGGKPDSTPTAAASGSDVVIEYNHSDYADLLTPAPAIKPRMIPTSVIKSAPPTVTKLPKRPGSMPPFALFSQEMRTKLQTEEPDIGFGDLGRRLGEMWHSLKEEEKEDYRKRAREVADAKMKSWKETVNSIPKHKQMQMEQNQQPR
ncbi:high mobility group protein B3 [Eurytemora carolleeae]|uniref:high mobility group protein B3 n=1 Tax=Eurytemora carolleeae TaxID=1294199 RepID=UPI000C75EAC5|nr:high mobility group protein B3 [Eurytemora carolleeae]|eukprot:XP_023333712.1 high mobility group protein B3-like [Eurytemora affinis]